MECPFQVGDEIVPIKTLPLGGTPNGDRLNREGVYLVDGFATDYCGNIGVVLRGFRSAHPTGAYLASAFRKVQKPRTTLSIESFLTIKPDQFEEPRRAPAKTPEKADV